MAAKGEVFFTPEQIALADIDGNGIVDSVDASLVLVFNARKVEDPDMTIPKLLELIAKQE